MDRRLLQLAVAGLAILVAPTLGVADEPSPDCSVDRRPRRPLDSGTRFRAVVSMVIPSLYASLEAEGRKTLEVASARPTATTTVLRSFHIDKTRQLGWEIGVFWNPVRILERSRRLARARRRAARRRLMPEPIHCSHTPSLPDDGPESTSSNASFETRLRQTISRQKRRSFKALLD